MSRVSFMAGLSTGHRVFPVSALCAWQFGGIRTRHQKKTLGIDLLQSIRPFRICLGKRTSPWVSSASDEPSLDD